MRDSAIYPCCQLMSLLFCLLQKDVQPQIEAGLKKFFNAALYPKIKFSAYSQDVYRF